MDPRIRADEALARARSRGAYIVTPDNATSPMDASSTVRIPRNIISGADAQDPNSTAVFPQQSAPQDEGPAPAWPQNDYGQPGYAPPQQHPQGHRNPQAWAHLGTQQFPPR